MVKKREGFKVIILEPALSRLKRKECPACGKPRKKWTRTQKYRCCSKECTNKWTTLYKIVGWNDFAQIVYKK